VVNAVFGTASKPKVIIPKIMIMEVILLAGMIKGSRMSSAGSVMPMASTCGTSRDAPKHSEATGNALAR
jgi:hypothetical protein